jgi:hypothetical protein
VRIEIEDCGFRAITENTATRQSAIINPIGNHQSNRQSSIQSAIVNPNQQSAVDNPSIVNRHSAVANALAG